MCRKWLKKELRIYREMIEGKDNRFYAFGGWEIALIVAAVVLVFGVGKLANVGGALGKSLREFREEKDKTSNPKQLNTKETKEEKSEDES